MHTAILSRFALNKSVTVIVALVVVVLKVVVVVVEK